MVDEGDRCPFLLEHDDSKILTCLCNYYSLGQAELARALLHIVASQNLVRALRILKTVVWHGPPKHWLCSAFVPSSAHLAWFCLIDFQDLVEKHTQSPALLPPYLVKRLEFDVLIAQALLDGAAIQAQVLTAEVAAELRTYHAGLLCATSMDDELSPELKVPSSFKLPALSLLQVTTQVSPFANFLPASTTDRQEQVEHFANGIACLSKVSVQQLYDLCKSQPLLGWCVSRALAPVGVPAASSTARRIQQMYLGLTGDALLESHKGDAWRYLKFLEVSDTIGSPQSLSELLSILLISVISGVRPTPPLHSRLKAFVSMSTSTLSPPPPAPMPTSQSLGDAAAGLTSQSPSELADEGLGSRFRGSSSMRSEVAGSQVLGEIFAQAFPTDAGVGGPAQLRQHFQQVGDMASGLTGTQGGPGSPSLHYARFLKRIRGDRHSSPRDQDASATNGSGSHLGILREGDRAGAQPQLEGTSALRWTGEGIEGSAGGVQMLEPWEMHGPTEAARVAFQYRTRIYEAFLTHDSGGNHTALCLFSALEDEFLRLKSAQSPLPPAFELLQPLDESTSLFEEPPIAFWDAYFEFTRVADVHCLEYVVETAVRFIKAHDFGASAWLLAPFPQLKPLVILLLWPAFQGDVICRQSLLDTLWKSYSVEVQKDPSKTGDLLVDHWVEVLDYRLSVSWWISRLIVSQGGDSSRIGGGEGDIPATKEDLSGAAVPGASTTSTGPAPLAAQLGVQDSDRAAHSHIAAEVLNRVTSHSILYVMRPNLPLVASETLLSALQSLPPLRQARPALEHSYDLDLTRCYYAVRCAMSLVERCVNFNSQGGKQSFWSSTPGRQVIEEGVRELDRLITSIERTPFKVSVFLLITSLCYARHRHLDKGKRKDVSQRLPQSGQGGLAGANSDFVVPPSVLLSLLSLLWHHLRPLARPGDFVGDHGSQGLDLGPQTIISHLHHFTQETIWRIIICLKDFFISSRLCTTEESPQVKRARNTDDATPVAEDAALRELADAMGAVILSEIELKDFFRDMQVSGMLGAVPGSPQGGSAADEPDKPEDHPFLQFCTPMEVPLSLQPAAFVPQMLAGPITLLHRSLKMNDYTLSRRLLQYFPELRGVGEGCESVVEVAEQFKELRQGLINSRLQADASDEGLTEEFLAQLGQPFEADLKRLVSAIKVGVPRTPRQPMLSEGERGTGGASLLSSLSSPLLEFYVLVDLAVSAAPFSQMSTQLLKKAAACLTPGISDVPKPALLPTSESLLSFFENWLARLSVLVEVRPQFKGRASLASIILGIETLPSEPALLKSHLNRLHSQRHAIMSLVESVDLVKKGQTSASQRTLVDFLSSAIKSLTSEEEEGSGKAVTDTDARDQRDDAEQMAEGLGSSRYLLRFLEYLTKVADLMRSASIEAQARKTTTKNAREALRKPKKDDVIEVVMDSLHSTLDRAVEVPEDAVEVTKLFDVLAESPKGIVARLLFELGGHRQALSLSEVMHVDLVEVIVNSSWVLPVWNQSKEGKSRRAAWSQYPMSMEVVHYLAEHENPLSQVRCPGAPLLATMACLERRGRRWPSWKMLRFAESQSREFPSLQRWVEERCHVLKAIQWVDGKGRLTASTTLPTTGQGVDSTATAVSEDAEEAAEESEDDVADTDAGLASDAPVADAPSRQARGYTDAELQRLSVEDQLALEAVGADHEDAMTAAYTKLVQGLINEQRYEEALEVCDEHLPVDSELTDQVLHLYLNTPGDSLRPREATPFAPHSELPDHECMYRLKKHSLAARLTLERYKRWDVDTAVQTVTMCLQRLEAQPAGNDAADVQALRLEMKRILQKMITFEKILQVSGDRWKVWQEFEDMDREQVGDAVSHLLSLQQHDLARTLTQMYGMTDPLHSLELSRLHYLFTTKNDKTSAVNRLLSFPPAQAVSFALQLLDMFDLIHHRVLLCRMLLTRLHSWLSREEDLHLRVLLASLQLLSTVSDTMQSHFLRLLRKPARIVESLLMNSRVDLLEPFLMDFPEYRRDGLILRYARKALALAADVNAGSGGLALQEILGQESEGGDDDGDSRQTSGNPALDMGGAGLGGRWCLTGMRHEDRRIRDEHVFEEAPSISLAEKILELCSDRTENAVSCFAICDELSLRLHDLTPKFAASPAAAAGLRSPMVPPSRISNTSLRDPTSEDNASNGEDSETMSDARGSLAAGGGDVGSTSQTAHTREGGATSSAGSSADPLSSVRLLTFLIRRMLTYLKKKFNGAGLDIQVQLDRSLNNLDFMPMLWQISGHRIGLSQLCNPAQAAKLRDDLIRDDHVSLALELCERCGCATKASENSEQDADASAWRISADPVREAQALALHQLRRHGEAWNEFNQTELCAQSNGQNAAKATLASFEAAMRYPPLFDLASLEHVSSLFTFNSLQRKLYRSTSPLAPLPMFLSPSSVAHDSASAASPQQQSAKYHLPGAREQVDMEVQASTVPVPPVPIVPFGLQPGESEQSSSGRGAAAVPHGKTSESEAHLKAMEAKLRDAVSTASNRGAGLRFPASLSSLRDLGGGDGLDVAPSLVRRPSTQETTKPGKAVTKAHSPTEVHEEVDAGDGIDGNRQMAGAGDRHDGLRFLNGVAYLYPPIHPPELPRWSGGLQELVKGGKAGKPWHGHIAEAPAMEAPGAEEGVVPHPRPVAHASEDKERMTIGEELNVSMEAEVDVDKVREEEAEKRDTAPEVSYENRMMDVRRTFFGCAAPTTNLRSQSSLWPDDSRTHNLMQASPMALPLAVTPALLKTGERQLTEASFNELLHYQENHGTAESLLSMLVRERHLAQACYYIFNEKVSKRLFVDVVAHHCLAHNQFHELQRVILEFDPSLRRVQEYLNVLKEFLRNRRALDLLYSYQVFTKDYVNAGLLAIQLFIASNTWDARVGHLQNAYAHLTVAHRQLSQRRRGHHGDFKEGTSTDTAADSAPTLTSSSAADAAGEVLVDGISGLEITEAALQRNLETVKLQMSVCEAMPTVLPTSCDLFGPLSQQCEVAERLLVSCHFDLAHRVIDFLDLPVVELCIRASNQIATTEARSPTGSIAPVMRFLKAIRKLPPVEWDSLVSNVVNIWIIEKAEMKADPSQAGQLIKFIQDERCRMDAHVLTGNLQSAFRIAQRQGNLQDVLHIRTCVQRAGDQELLKQINAFLAYASPGKDYLKKNLAF